MGTTGSSWTAGVLLGLLDGFLLFEFPLLSLGLLLVAAFLALRDRARAAGIGGLLVGLGGCWTFFLARATLDCEAFNRVPNQSCTVLGIDPFFALAVAVLLAGVGVTIVAIRGRRRPPEA